MTPGKEAKNLKIYVVAISAGKVESYQGVTINISES